MKIIKLKKCSDQTAVHTRNEIIGLWQMSHESILNKFCCPNCRNLLFKFKDRDEYYCANNGCKYFYGGDI